MSMIKGDVYVREIWVLPIHNVSIDDMDIVYAHWFEEEDGGVVIDRMALETDEQEWRSWGFSAAMLEILQSVFDDEYINRIVFIPGD